MDLSPFIIAVFCLIDGPCLPAGIRGYKVDTLIARQAGFPSFRPFSLLSIKEALETDMGRQGLTVALGIVFLILILVVLLVLRLT